jgi:hypothetical protein
MYIYTHKYTIDTHTHIDMKHASRNGFVEPFITALWLMSSEAECCILRLGGGEGGARPSMEKKKEGNASRIKHGRISW